MIAVSNRELYRGADYPAKLCSVVKLHPYGIILREKTMDLPEYRYLLKGLTPVCQRENVLLFVHNHMELAVDLGCTNIHLSIPELQRVMVQREPVLRHFDHISVSCHSYEDVLTAESAGATQIVLGTIFETECKKGLRGRGTTFVREITHRTNLPVYAIGGIKPSNLHEVMEAGATGGCMMSGFMEE